VLSGFETKAVANGIDAKKLIVNWQPRVLLVDMLLPGGNAFDILAFMQTDKVAETLDTAVIVMSGHNSDQNIKDAYMRGARDYMARPIQFQDLLTRLVFHCREVREIAEVNDDSTEALKLADIVISQALQKLPFEDMLFQFARMAGLKLQSLRCSVVHYVTQDRGVVIASSDRRDIAGYPLDLRKYPEVQLVVNTGKTIVIDDLDQSRALSRIKTELKDISFNALIVAPIFCRGKPFGVFSVRMPPSTGGKLKDEDVRFIEYLGKVMSLYLATQNMQDLGRYGLISA
jgi:DNA-binding response OmpR family regulator